ncbi:hypothetical protein [Bacillus sp. JJ722]|uniref:hypothetical protein n=1 Tax=Bacillus sp. JJ722 TaxID=3122973 RepID=UPI003000C434
MSKELTPAIATQHVFNQTYDFLKQEKLKAAKTVTVAIRQNDIKIVQIEIDMDKFIPTNNPNENKTKTVTAASTIAKMPDDVKQYGTSTGLW